MKIQIRFLILVACFLTTVGSVSAKVELSGVYSDHMVLQRGAPVPVWGWAEAGEQITVEFAGQKKSAVTDANGKWMVKLDPLLVSIEPQELRVSGASPNETIVISDVLVGDVWLCSGQSNMEFVMSQLKNTPYESDLTTANFPLIRQGVVQRDPSVEPTNDATVLWKTCTPKTVGGFTAAGFYFARLVSKELGVPIGLIHSSWGGTSAESWTSKSALDTVPNFKIRADGQIQALKQLPDELEKFPAAITAWEQENGRADTQNIGEQNGWQKAGADVSDWQRGQLDAKWLNAGLTNGGIIWLRKKVDLPESVAGRTFRLNLGLIDEQYITAYWNGEKIGEFGRKASESNFGHFYYSYMYFDVPPKLLKPGTNVFALRYVVDTPGKAPMTKGALKLEFTDLGAKHWNDDCLIKVEREFPPLSKAALVARPAVPKGDGAHTASALFNGMIYPLIPFAIKGTLWYQGEQDSSHAFTYRTMLPLMISDWRSRWGFDFPFVIQQLPNYKASGITNTEWAELREAQALTAKSLTNCYISVGIDIGEADNVHPKNKREIGRRLGLVTLAEVYGETNAFCGPVYESMAVEGNSIRLKFRYSDGLTSLNGQPLNNFTIAGADQKFVPAEAKIDGDTVIVSSPRITEPVAVRYAFINDPEGCNFSNANGLPAMPFRTDAWPASTYNNK
ncbi:MAG TPA: sialate O-acetylesterase [Pseudomonadales bacterium]|nr:sialate O-acetylesterase [Pseudomonadales bacterium]